MNRYVRATISVIAMACAVAYAAGPALADKSDHWIGTWSAAMHQPSPGPPNVTSIGFTNQTLRQIVHTSIGGTRVRVRLSTFGAGALVVGAAHIAIREARAAIVPGTDRALTFGGQASVRIPPGAVVISDAVDLEVPALTDLAISIYVPGQTGPATWHRFAQQTSYVSPAGDFSAALDMPVNETVQSWFWLAAVEVLAPKQAGAIAAFGDSLTDGARSTPDQNQRWPDYLSRALVAQHGNHQMGVLNAAIGGNRLLYDGIGPNALARFEPDVLTQAGVSHVIILLGNNDIVFGNLLGEVVTSAEIVQAHRMLIARARAHGLTTLGATLPPFMGFGAAPETAFPALDAKRRAVNEWIRFSGEYDAVIDFDAVLRDPFLESRLLPLYDSGDHLHPNDAGYEAMGLAVDLTLFKKGERGRPH
jgi:lysophospholipase L1-like esterase